MKVARKNGNPSSHPPSRIPNAKTYDNKGAPKRNPSDANMENMVYKTAVSFLGTSEVRKDRVAAPKPDPIMDIAIAGRCEYLFIDQVAVGGIIYR